MRRILWYDIETAAHALTCVPKQQWSKAVHGWITQAHAAHCYSKRFHRPHPNWGAGALSEVLRFNPKKNGRPVSEQYEEMAAVFSALAEHRRVFGGSK